MDQRPRRWRFRISTLMLLVIIAALLFERWQRERDIRRTEAALQARLQQAAAEAVRAQTQAALAKFAARVAQQQDRSDAELARKEGSGRGEGIACRSVTSEEAEQFRRAIEGRMALNLGPLAVYRCEACGGAWQVGHMTA